MRFGWIIYTWVCMICGVGLAFFIIWSTGLIGWIANFTWIVVFIVGFYGSTVLISILFEGWSRFFYPPPLCRQRECQGADYESYGSDLNRFGSGMFCYRCKCGDYYVRFGKRFMQGHFDEEQRPTYLSAYKKLIGFRKWGDDQQEDEDASLTSL